MNKNHRSKHEEIHTCGSRGYAQTADLLVRTLFYILVIGKEDIKLNYFAFKSKLKCVSKPKLYFNECNNHDVGEKEWKANRESRVLGSSIFTQERYCCYHKSGRKHCKYYIESTWRDVIFYSCWQVCYYNCCKHVILFNCEY